MNKNHPFVFLPTDKPSRVIKLENIKEYLFLESETGVFNEGESYAFAYVLADIKPDEVGVWAYCPFHLGGQVFISKGKGFICDACRKIIATNDFKLNACISSNPKEQFVPVPQISDSSLAILVGLKNKGINEVDVEYEEILGKPYMAKGRGIEISPDTVLPKLKDGNIVIVKYVCPKCNDTGRCEPTLGEPDGKECICVVKESEDEAIEHASTDYRKDIRGGFVLGARWMRGYMKEAHQSDVELDKLLEWLNEEIEKDEKDDSDSDSECSGIYINALYSVRSKIQSLKEQSKK